MSAWLVTRSTPLSLASLILGAVALGLGLLAHGSLIMLARFDTSALLLLGAVLFMGFSPFPALLGLVLSVAAAIRDERRASLVGALVCIAGLLPVSVYVFLIFRR